MVRAPVPPLEGTDSEDKRPPVWGKETCPTGVKFLPWPPWPEELPVCPR